MRAVSNKGMGYDGTEAIVIEDANGSGAVLRPVIGGNFYLEANFTNADGEFLEDRVRLLASRRNELTEREAWLDLHMDNFSAPVAGWWTLDSDGDGITNLGEFLVGTSPENADTDGDGLNDFDENATFGTNPLQADTDGDGLIDQKSGSI